MCITSEIDLLKFMCTSDYFFIQLNDTQRSITQQFPARANLFLNQRTFNIDLQTESSQTQSCAPMIYSLAKTQPYMVILE